MKIAIEAQRIFRPNKHGMDFVALETIRCLQRLDTKNEYFIFTGEGEDRCLEESPNMHITTLRCPSYPLWEQWALPRAVARVKPDLLHCTSNTAPVWGNAPLILTLHDIIFLEQQAARNKSLYQSLGRVYRRLVVPRILPRCRMVITVSQFECDRIRTALNFDPGRIMAIHNGYNDRFRPMEGTAETVRKYLRDPEYLFFLGNTDPKKNTPGTLKAYAEYVRRSENPLPLLVADLGEQPAEAILREIGEPRLRGMLRLAGYIPNSDLPAIYNRASAFLYTSLRESFGIPQLEAMACGTPVVTSATSAIPEVAGEGAILVDPTDPKADIGPVSSKAQFEKIAEYVQAGIDEGARLVMGGVPTDMSRGYYVRPVVFSDVRNDMRIAREEIFGPVLCIIPYDTVEEAVSIANDTPYGLSGYVHAPTKAEAVAVAKRIHSGNVYINDAPRDVTAPFGGYKQSGIGREGGLAGLLEFTQQKAVFDRTTY